MVGVAAIGLAGPPQQRADAGRQLLRGERLREVVVGAGLEAGDDVVGVGPGGDHDDRDVARAPDRPAHLEAVDAREHDVDEHDVGRVAVERLERVLAGLGLLDLPALVLEGHLDRGADALVVLDGQDARAHASIIAHQRQRVHVVRATSMRLVSRVSTAARNRTPRAARSDPAPPSVRKCRPAGSSAHRSRQRPKASSAWRGEGGELAEVDIDAVRVRRRPRRRRCRAARLAVP